MVRNSFEHELVMYGYLVTIPCLFLPTLIYHFTSTFLDRPDTKIILSIWIFSVVLVVLICTGIMGSIEGVYNYPWGNIYKGDQLFRIGTCAFLFFYYFIILSSCWFLFRAYKQTEPGLERRHTLYILVSFLVIAIAMVKIAVVLGVNAPILLPIGMLLNDLFGALIGVAIIKERLFNITIIIKKSALYSALAAIVFFIFSFSEHVLITYFGKLIGEHSQLIHLISIAVGIAALMPIKHRLEHGIEKYFEQKKLEL